MAHDGNIGEFYSCEKGEAVRRKGEQGGKFPAKRPVGRLIIIDWRRIRAGGASWFCTLSPKAPLQEATDFSEGQNTSDGRPNSDH